MEEHKIDTAVVIWIYCRAGFWEPMMALFHITGAIRVCTTDDILDYISIWFAWQSLRDFIWLVGIVSVSTQRIQKEAAVARASTEKNRDLKLQKYPNRIFNGHFNKKVIKLSTPARLWISICCTFLPSSVENSQIASVSSLVLITAATLSNWFLKSFQPLQKWLQDFVRNEVHIPGSLSAVSSYPLEKPPAAELGQLMLLAINLLAP